MAERKNHTIKTVSASILVILLVITIYPIPTKADESYHEITLKIISKAITMLNKAVEYLESFLEEEQRDSFMPNTFEDELNNILNQIIATLFNSQALEYRKEILKLQKEIKEASQEIAECKTKMLSAPVKKKWYNILTKTKKDYQKEIQQLKQDIRTKKEQIKHLKNLLIAELKKMGLNMNDKQLQSLLKSVVADDIIGIISVIENIKLLNAQLKTIMEDQDYMNIDIARKYYGIHVLLIKMVMMLYEREIDIIENTYIKKLEDIKTEALETIKQALKELDEVTTEKNKQILRENIKSNELTFKVAEMYQKYLRMQKEAFQQKLKILQENYKVALNTFMTVKTAKTLINMINIDTKNLQALLDLKIPPIPVFKNKAMEVEYEKLSEMLKENL